MPLGLALLDAVPVLLTAAGLAVVARLIAERQPRSARIAALGAAFVVTGGAARAGWKLIVAGGGPDLPLLFAALYPSLAIGYLLLVGTASGRLRHPWLPALTGLVALGALSAIAGASGGRLVPLAWLVTGGLASIALDGLLARRAAAIGRRDAAALMVAHALGILVLQGLARPADQSIALQWVQESLNVGTQVAFLVAAITLLRAERHLVRAAEPVVARA